MVPTRSSVLLLVLFCVIAVRSFRLDELYFDLSGISNDATIVARNESLLSSDDIDNLSLLQGPLVEDNIGKETEEEPGEQEEVEEVETGDEWSQRRKRSSPSSQNANARIPLDTLTARDRATARDNKDKPSTFCPEGQVWLSNRVVGGNSKLEEQRARQRQERLKKQKRRPKDKPSTVAKIPSIIHQAARTRCVPSHYPQWRDKGPSFSFYLHDGNAQDYLLHQDWPEFPLLSYALECIQGSREAKAGLWKHLVLWEYGGIVVDWNVDGTPWIDPKADAMMIMQQNFQFPEAGYLAFSPRHPIMYFAIQTSIQRILYSKNLSQINQAKQGWSHYTGADITERGFIMFFRDNGVRDDKRKRKAPKQTPGEHKGRTGRHLSLFRRGRKLKWRSQVPVDWPLQVFGPDDQDRFDNRSCMAIAYDIDVGPSLPLDVRNDVEGGIFETNHTAKF